MTEADYRLAVDRLLSRLDAAFAEVDPDLAESEYAQGTLVVTFRQGPKLVLSPQAPVRQIWAAFRDRAWHFEFARAQGQWLDDRGQGIDIVALVTSLAREQAGVDVKP
ncbi:MAG: iron donor protein CyaY [Deltaproteobacteria bacterium]|jgi:iron donor protein CyaY|nr:iron donor protein CyaY [Deltaproteobacteria bacterium]